jgi:hypothetical protein
VTKPRRTSFCLSLSQLFESIVGDRPILRTEAPMPHAASHPRGESPEPTCIGTESLLICIINRFTERYYNMVHTLDYPVHPSFCPRALQTGTRRCCCLVSWPPGAIGQEYCSRHEYWNGTRDGDLCQFILLQSSQVVLWRSEAKCTSTPMSGYDSQVGPQSIPALHIS